MEEDVFAENYAELDIQDSSELFSQRLPLPVSSSSRVHTTMFDFPGKRFDSAKLGRERDQTKGVRKFENTVHEPLF